MTAAVQLADDLPLFSAALRQTAAAAAAKPAGLAEPSPVEAALAEVHPDELTPRAALDLVYRLTALLRGAGGKGQA
jgi:DNA mismatch repair protein MutS